MSKKKTRNKDSKINEVDNKKISIYFDDYQFNRDKERLSESINRINKAIPLLQQTDEEINLQFLIDFWALFNNNYVENRQKIGQKFVLKELEKQFVKYGYEADTEYNRDIHSFMMQIARAESQPYYRAMEVIVKYDNGRTSALDDVANNLIDSKYIQMIDNQVQTVENIDEILTEKNSVFVKNNKQFEIFEAFQKVVDLYNLKEFKKFGISQIIVPNSFNNNDLDVKIAPNNFARAVKDIK